MGRQKGNCCCGGCNVRDNSCTSCKKCKPKYLCVEVVVTPGPYSVYSECCETFGFRMPYDCGGYAGAGSCPDGVTLDVDIRLSETEYGCFTVVSSSLLESDITLEGTLPAIEFTVFNAAGDQLDVTIGAANVVENPMAKVACAVCSCNTCLPGTLCVELYFAARFAPEIMGSRNAGIIPALRLAVSAPFECSQWAMPDQSVADPDYPEITHTATASLTLLDPSTGLCGIHVLATMDDATVDDIIILDDGMHPRRFHGTVCEGNDGLNYTIGVPELLPCDGPGECDDPDPQEFESYVNACFDPQTYEGVSRGVLCVRDQSCGTCLLCEPQPDDCPCCGTLVTTLTLTCALGSATFIGSTTGSVEDCTGQTGGWTQFGGSLCFPGQVTPYAITCNADGTDTWVLSGPASGNVILTGTCSPVLHLTGTVDGTDFEVTE